MSAACFVGTTATIAPNDYAAGSNASICEREMDLVVECRKQVGYLQGGYGIAVVCPQQAQKFANPSSVTEQQRRT